MTFLCKCDIIKVLKCRKDAAQLSSERETNMKTSYELMAKARELKSNIIAEFENMCLAEIETLFNSNEAIVSLMENGGISGETYFKTFRETEKKIKEKYGFSEKTIISILDEVIRTVQYTLMCNGWKIDNGNIIPLPYKEEETPQEEKA